MQIGEQHKKFLEVFIDTHDIKEAMTQAKIPKEKMQHYLRVYKNMYEGFFEKLGMSKEDIIMKHIELIKDPIKKVIHDHKTDTETTTYDNGVKLKAIEMYYKLIKALDDSSVVINTTTDVDKEKELQIANAIAKDPKLVESIMAAIETSNKEENK